MTTDGAVPSPLGRYDEPGETENEPHGLVQLLGVPVQLIADGRQHHDELMREFALLSLSEDDRAANDARSDVPQRLLELVQLLGVRYGRAASRPDQVIDEAIERGDAQIDLVYEVPQHVVTAADQLETLLMEADEFCRGEQLLTLARSDLQVRFAHWYLDEFRRQLVGEPPLPWDGPLAP